MTWYIDLPYWNPYVVGVGIGLLSCLAFLLSDRPIGCSTAFVKTRGMIERLIRGSKVETMEYYRQIPPRVDWQFMIVPGIMIGAFLSAVLGGTFRPDWIPPLWQQTFGGNIYVRILVALIGGFFLAIGARWAGGCTSGHGISGSLQLSVASIVSASCFFAGGILTAMVLIHVIG